MKNIMLYVLGTSLVFLLLSTCVTSQLLGEDEPGDDERRSEEALLDDNEYHDVMKRLSDYFQTQKRHLCRRYFIYNPVRGKCQPTLMALRKGARHG